MTRARPPEGFYRVTLQTRKHPQRENQQETICPNCSAWFHFDTTREWVESGFQDEDAQAYFDFAREWAFNHKIIGGHPVWTRHGYDIREHESRYAIVRCRWCQARMWMPGYGYLYRQTQVYLEPKAVPIAKNPFLHDYHPQADLPVDGYGLIFGCKIQPELKETPVYTDYPLDLRPGARPGRRDEAYATPWRMIELADTVWYNIHTGRRIVLSHAIYDRWGQPVWLMGDLDDYYQFAHTVGQYNESCVPGKSVYLISHWVRVCHLPPSQQLAWMKFAVGEGQEDVWDIQAETGGQMALL